MAIDFRGLAERAREEPLNQQHSSRPHSKSGEIGRIEEHATSRSSEGTTYPEWWRRGAPEARGFLHEQRQHVLESSPQTPKPNKSDADAEVCVMGWTICAGVEGTQRALGPDPPLPSLLLWLVMETLGVEQGRGAAERGDGRPRGIRRRRRGGEDGRAH